MAKMKYGKTGRLTIKGKRKGRFRPYKRRKLGTLSQSMRPMVFKFKRDLEETLVLSATAAPDGWTLDGNSRVYKNVGWALSSIGDPTDFTNLFKQYKLCGARMKFFFSNTSSDMDQNNYSNSQLLIRMAPNDRGEQVALNSQYWQSIQAKKYRLGINGGRPISIYMPLYIKNEVENSTGTGKSMMKPRFISNNDTSVIHHGLNIAIERVDGQGFSTGSTNYQYVKVITTIYFMTRAVV